MIKEDVMKNLGLGGDDEKEGALRRDEKQGTSGMNQMKRAVGSGKATAKR